jgi:hypothetical protein
VGATAVQEEPPRVNATAVDPHGAVEEIIEKASRYAREKRWENSWPPEETVAQDWGFLGIFVKPERYRYVLQNEKHATSELARAECRRQFANSDFVSLSHTRYDPDTDTLYFGGPLLAYMEYCMELQLPPTKMVNVQIIKGDAMSLFKARQNNLIGELNVTTGTFCVLLFLIKVNKRFVHLVQKKRVLFSGSADAAVTIWLP